MHQSSELEGLTKLAGALLLLMLLIIAGVVQSIMSSYGITFDKFIHLAEVSLFVAGIAGLIIGWQFSKGKRWWGIVAGSITVLGTVRLGWFVWAETGWSMLLSSVIGGVAVGIAINLIVLAIVLAIVWWQNRKHRSEQSRRQEASQSSGRVRRRSKREKQNGRVRKR